MGIVRKEDIHNTFDDYIRDMHSNPNLLINSYFSSVINQRTKGTYSASVGDKYTIDRWRIGDASTLEIKSDGVLVTIPTKYSSFTQHMEVLSWMKGKTITLSGELEVTNGKVYSEIAYTNSSGVGVSTCYYYLPLGTHKFSVTGVLGSDISTLRTSITNGNDGASTFKMKWLKLELGSKATPFVPRLFGEELALCKRYYEVIDRVFRTTGFTLGDGMFAIEYPFLVEKRVPPTVVLPSDKTGVIEVVGARNSTPTNLESFTTIDGVRFTGVLADDPNRIVGLNFRTYADAEIY